MVKIEIRGEMTTDWRFKARNTFPPGTTLEDIRSAGKFETEYKGSHHCGGNFIYLATFPRGILSQNVRIYLRDVMGIQNVAAGLLEERIYVHEDCIPKGVL